METIDAIDKRILNILQRNAIESVKEIANKVGLSASPTYERIKRMERLGIISKYVALLDKEQIDKGMVVMCNVSLKKHAQAILEKFESTIVKLDEVMEVQCMSGTYDYLLKVVTKDVKSYHDFVMHKLSSIDNIAHVQSWFVMKEIKMGTAFKL
jgi:DNA-binding Lrp family transcriptional regulator